MSGECIVFFLLSPLTARNNVKIAYNVLFSLLFFFSSSSACLSCFCFLVPCFTILSEMGHLRPFP